LTGYGRESRLPRRVKPPQESPDADVRQRPARRIEDLARYRTLSRERNRDRVEPFSRFRHNPGTGRDELSPTAETGIDIACEDWYQAVAACRHFQSECSVGFAGGDDRKVLDALRSRGALQVRKYVQVHAPEGRARLVVDEGAPNGRRVLGECLGALFSLLLFGMLTRQATAAGGVAGMLAGVGTAAAMTAGGQIYLWTAWWSFVAASAALVATSAFTTRKSEDELRGLVAWVR
jgi:hypothetical protein